MAEPQHGTRAMYGYRKCRCTECRAYQAKAMREYAARRRAQDGVSLWFGRKRATCERSCEYCTQTFSGRTDSAQRFCTLTCASRHKAHQKRKLRSQVEAYAGPPLLRTPAPRLNPIPVSKRKFKSAQCRMCATWFVTLYTDVTCSTDCQAERERAIKRNSKDRRRARKKAAYVADVWRKEVFERDGYRCHLCRKKTLPHKQVPHPRAPTLDHVIPLASGGTHEPLNTRTACFLCNATKSDRGGGEQLLLIA